MKKFMPLIKNNLISLIAIVLALLAAPAMWFVSSGWRTSIREQIDDKVRQDLSQVNSVDVTYALPQYIEGVEGVSVKTPPNAATTARVSTLLQNLSQQVKSVRESAIDFNSEDKKLLVGSEGGDQLFPEPSSESARLRLLDQMVDIWPAAHRQLLDDHNAGRPPAPIGIRTRLETEREREIARRSGGAGTLSPEQEDQVAEALGRKRLDFYSQHANGLRFYATDEVFEAVVPWDSTVVLPIETAWEWQHLYWVHEDIIRGLAQANSGRGSSFIPVNRAPVKRVLSINVSGPEAQNASGGGRGGRGNRDGGGGAGEAQPPSVDDRTPIEANYSLSHTGRVSWPVAPNSMFDIRYVDLEILADSARLTDIFEALAEVNFMTVVGVDIEEYDPADDLVLGYDYGGDHIVKANLRVESLWLRSWLGQYMPASVRQANGIPDPAPAEGEGDDRADSTEAEG